jgi:hypothetical protein
MRKNNVLFTKLYIFLKYYEYTYLSSFLYNARYNIKSKFIYLFIKTAP